MKNARWAAGGNAPHISNRFALEGFNHVVVGAQASSKVKSMFSSKLDFVETLQGDDDIHFVLEFKVGEKWGNFTVPRANRFIIHSDQNNPRLRTLESFRERVKLFKPRLVVVGGLQMLDGYPFAQGEQEQRLKDLSLVLENIPLNTLIHFEMASFAEKTLIQTIIDDVIPYSDSIGMNEQELPNLVEMAEHGKLVTIADSNPRTATVLDDMRRLYKFFQLKSNRGGLSRIHIHTLSFQIVLIKTGSQWKNNKAASAKASLTAYRYVCGSDKIDPNKARLIMDDSFASSVKEGSARVPFDEHSPISCWNEEDYEFCIAPVLVCTDVKQTAGAGDNISPAGLMFQI